jgi:hypothetical protein
MTTQQIKDNAPHGATHYRKIFLFKQYFMKNTNNGFWYHYAHPFWFFYDSEKPLFIKPL